MAPSLNELIHRADLDALVRHVDDTCAARDWEHVVTIRDAARAAVESGRQLWPIATLANYRLALWAPAELAVLALADTARMFMPGPVSEILAVHHSWAELSAHLETGHDRSLVAHERALRGDTIDPDEPSVLDVPFAVATWEPRYHVATYDDSGVVEKFERAAVTSMINRSPGSSVTAIENDPTIEVFRRMMDPWTAQSNGTATASVVEGGPADALAALGHGANGCTWWEIPVSEALAQLTWAASTGAAHGKRRGVATGRGEAWWLLANVCAMADEWPLDPDEFGEVLGACRFHNFAHDKAPTTGWGLHLVISDPDEGISVALSATDRS